MKASIALNQARRSDKSAEGRNSAPALFLLSSVFAAWKKSLSLMLSAF